ncbi:10615_t:CDS:2, partial [Racocetra fulgida]
ISKYVNANIIKENFLELTSDYDKCMEDLHFTFVIAQDEQKRYDQESLESDLAEMSEEPTDTDTQISAPRLDPTLLKDIEPEIPQ